MNRSNLSLWLTKLSWAVLIFDLLLVFVVPADVNFPNLLLLLIYTAWLILSLMTVSTWLIIRHHLFFRNWIGWMLPVIGLIAGNAFAFGFQIKNANLSFFFSLLTIISGWSVGIATIVLLWHKDKSLTLIGWGSAIIIWILLLSWRLQGNLFELWVYSLNNLERASPLWWFNPIMCIFGWIIPLSLIGFSVHTIRLIALELSSSDS